MDVSVGVKLPGLVPTRARTFRDLVDLVVELEDVGFDDVLDSEHILFAPEMHHPGGAGTMVHGRDRHHSDRTDPLMLFAAIASRTHRIRMVSGVLLPAAHGFAVLARQAATLDRLSDGRFTLGVGAGWFEGEFVAMGIPPEERAARMEETVRACQALWRDGLASFEGRWTSFTGMLAEPQPSTPGGVPVWFGGDGRSKPTARRVVELGAGWMSREAASYDEIAASIEHVNEVAAGAGRDASTLGFRTSIVPTPPGAIEGPTEQLIEKAVASAARLAGAGVTHLSVPWNYYAFSIEDMATLLAAVRQA